MQEEGALILSSKFVLDLRSVDPIPTLQDISSSVSDSLGDQTGSFNSFVSLIDQSLDSVSNFLELVAQDNRTQLMLDALLDFSIGLNMSSSSLGISSELKHFTTKLNANIASEFRPSFGSQDLQFLVTPSIILNLEASNYATPFNVFDAPGDLTKFTFEGWFDSSVTVGIETPQFPATVTMSASSEDITSGEQLNFTLTLDIDLRPISNGECNALYTSQLPL